ncbi:fumarylacetoacetate hydrolase family protein [Robbsia andropogonis]|nr:fumarylacetoacetate hydrolase family protein [Robbsia andropogonis]MCP1120652.1 fumarylacetoacetate hydrolase family protein [Robbsia andropogonis]MCP1130387.1 fumarylacetoacetate hydrolase family protein [Robbsia andropogonis]
MALRLPYFFWLPMKLATLKDGTRDGQLIVVSRDLQSAAVADAIAPTLQRVLEDWHFYAPQLRTLYESLNSGRVRRAFKFDATACMAPLPRAWRCIDATHPIEGNATTGEWFAARRADALVGARDDILVADDARQLALRAGLAAYLGDIAPGASPMEAVSAVRLLTLFASFQASPSVSAEATQAKAVPGWFDATAHDALAFAPLAVTPDVFGEGWHHGVLRRRIDLKVNGQRIAEPDAAANAAAAWRADIGGFATVAALLGREQGIGAGTIVLGAPGIARPDADMLAVGDRVAVDMRDDKGVTYCGTIETSVAPRTDGDAMDA